VRDQEVMKRAAETVRVHIHAPAPVNTESRYAHCASVGGSDCTRSSTHVRGIGIG
jgi:hypothetical protein